MGTDEQRQGVDVAKAHLAAQVADPQLRAKLTPDYELGCKRILRSDDFYPADAACDAGNAAHQALLRARHRDGRWRELPFDAVVFGTGFASQAFHGDLAVLGAAGANLSQA